MQAAGSVDGTAIAKKIMAVANGSFLEQEIKGENFKTKKQR